MDDWWKKGPYDLITQSLPARVRSRVDELTTFAANTKQRLRRAQMEATRMATPEPWRERLMAGRIAPSDLPADITLARREAWDAVTEQFRDEYGQLVDSFQDAWALQQVVIEEGYDAIWIHSNAVEISPGGNQLLVFDPKKVTVIDE